MAHIDVMFTEEEIAERIKALGAEIREAYGDQTITVVGVLKGSFIFMADLIRAIGGDVRCEFLGVSSYKGTQSSGEVRITHDLAVPVETHNVLICEDIVDTGLTLSFLLKSMRVRNPKTLKVVTLLNKPSRRTVPVEVDFTGFTIPDKFVIGFGLDLDQEYRNLPYIGIYNPDS